MKLKSMMVQMGLSGVLALATVAAVPAAHAFGLGDLKAAAGGGESAEQGGVDVKTLLSQQQDLMGRFNSSMNNMLLAQSKTLAAAGLKEEAQRAGAAAENYKSGNVVSEEQLKRDALVSAESNSKIEQLLKQGGNLSADGQKMLVSAVPHYAKGMYDGTRLPKEFESWTSSAQGGLDSLASNPLDAGKLSSGLKDVTTVATNLPNLLKTWGSTSAAFVSYAKSNKVDVSDVESKLGDL
jgi:hypothetical protein